MKRVIVKSNHNKNKLTLNRISNIQFNQNNQNKKITIYQNEEIQQVSSKYSKKQDLESIAKISPAQSLKQRSNSQNTLKKGKNHFLKIKGIDSDKDKLKSLSLKQDQHRSLSSQKNIVQLVEILQEMFYHMKDGCMISQIDHLNYSIKKVNLEKLMQQLVNFMLNFSVNIRYYSKNSFQFMNDHYIKLERFLIMGQKQIIASKNSTSLKRTKNIHDPLNKNFNNISDDILELRMKKNSLQTKINGLEKIRETISKEIHHKEGEKYELLILNQKLVEKSHNLQKELAQAKTILQFLKNQQSQIFNFMGIQQNKKIFNEIIKQYQLNTANILKNEVQSNVLESNHPDEPLSHKAIYNLILQDIRQIKQHLITYNQSVPSEDTSTTMRDFIARIMEAHLKKDAKINKLIQFKTKFIRKFIQFIKKWFSNWQLKQSFLLNLRKEFVGDSKTISELLMNLIACNQKQDKNYLNIKQQFQVNYQKLMQNYKIGNLFY